MSSATLIPATNLSSAEAASNFFITEVTKLLGTEVLKIEQFGGEQGAATGVLVHIRNRRTPEAAALYRLKREMLHQFPRARVDVWISEVRPTTESAG